MPTRNLLLRDYLRGYPDDAARYGALKRRLAALHDKGGDYTRAKIELIQELTDKAQAERGLRRRQCGRSERCGRTERCEGR